MKGLSTEMATKIARQAVAAGAKVVRDAARAKAPKDTGALRAGVVMKREPRSELTAEYVVTLSTREMRKYVDKSRHANVELQGPLAPRMVNGRVMRPTKLLARRESWDSYGDLFYGRFHEFGTVKMPARPFLRPALEENTARATEAIANRLRQRLEKVKQK